MQHFRNPKNIGEIKNPDAMAEVGNMVCGDQLSFTIKVKDNIIKDIRFLSFGCASNIATASVMTEMVKGMTLLDAMKFDWNKIVKKLEGLPSQKIHCSILAVEGLREVVSDYIKKYPEVLDELERNKVKKSNIKPRAIKPKASKPKATKSKTTASNNSKLMSSKTKKAKVKKATVSKIKKLKK